MIVFKILGWILLVLLILLIVLLHFSVTVNVHAGRDGFIVKAKYLFLTLYPRRKKAEEEEVSDEDVSELLSDEFTEEQLIQNAAAEQPPSGQQKPKEKEEKPESKEESKKEDKKPAKKDDKKKKESKKEDSSADAEISGGDSEEKEDKPSLRDKIAGIRRKYEKIKPYIPMTWKWFRRLLKAVRIRIDDLWVDVGRDDAHEAAIFYGSIQAFISSIMATFAEWFTLKVKKWDVNCRFAQNVIDGGTDISVRVRPSTLIAIVLCLGVNFLYIWIKGKIAAKRAAKKAKQSDNGAAAAAET